jgi:hypothetical protein
VIFRHIFGVFSWRVWLHHVENTPPELAVWLGGGGGGTLSMWLGLAHFHNGNSFLMISPNLLDIWPVFFLILSCYETVHLLILLRLPGDGYSLLGSKK